jgi:serine/threonine protein kinase
MNDSSATERHSIERLADEFMASYRAGRCPSVEEYVAQYPELADDLRGLLATLVLLERNGSVADSSDEDLIGRQRGSACPAAIGDFIIAREIGRGGMGVVYEAVQQSLGRQVALKVLSLPGLRNASHLERFRREARAAARLQHSHIVPVFDFGAHDGSYYYAMQYVAGDSLDVVIRSLRESRSANGGRRADQNRPSHSLPYSVGSGHGGATASPGTPPLATPAPDTSLSALSDTEFNTSVGRREFYRNVARVGLQAAEALAYAHSEGVLHRDIKPSNLLLDAKGNIWIADFGLAKLEGADELTQSGDFVGTLRYMAPERLEGQSDRRSDIYSLGVTLYELLTLQPFLPNKSRPELVRRIMEESPQAPRSIDGSIPADLETIVLTAIAKDPAARYPRAEQMSDDLQRFLADRPILARRSTALERFGRWCRRNPLVAALAATILLLLVAALAILSTSNAQIRRESQATTKALKERETALLQAQEALGNARAIYGVYAPHQSEDDVLKDLELAVDTDPKSADNLWLRGFEYGFLSRWDEAIRDLTKARPLLRGSKLIKPADRDLFVAMAYVGKGDRDGYRTECKAALEKLSNESKLGERAVLLWMCTVTPDAVDDPTKLADYVAAVLPPGDDSPTHDQLLSAGAGLYRAGRFAEARERIEETLRQVPKETAFRFPMSEVFASLFFAMTEARLGDLEAARTSFTAATNTAQSVQPSCWVEQLEQILLTSEAQSVIASAEASAAASTNK